jgi:hypothetical protein
MALGLTQPLTDMNPKEFSWGSKALPAREADNFAVCEPIV